MIGIAASVFALLSHAAYSYAQVVPSPPPSDAGVPLSLVHGGKAVAAWVPRVIIACSIVVGFLASMLPIIGAILNTTRKRSAYKQSDDEYDEEEFEED